MDDVRIGIVGTDNGHAAIYSSFFNGWRADVPLMTRLPDGSVALGHYIWGMRLAELQRLQPPAIPIAGARVTRLWGRREDVDLISRACEIEHPCADLDEIYEDVDAVMVLAGDPARNAGYAEPALRRGLPTYIDKPLCEDIATGERIFELANSSGAPCFTGSSLRYAPELRAARDVVQSTVGRVLSASVLCPRDFAQYGVHAVEMLALLFGTQGRVIDGRAYPDRDVAVVQYDSGVLASIEHILDLTHPFYRLTAVGTGGVHDVVLSRPVTPLFNLAHEFLRMVQTRRPPQPAAEALQVMTIVLDGIAAVRRTSADAPRVSRQAVRT
jgi:predicted dehydrogenase